MNKVNVVKSWVTKAGLDACILLVNETHHCGYVALPEPLVGKNFTDCNDDNIDIKVHGGVTYQGKPEWAKEREVIGFDCAHAGDAMRCPTKYIGTFTEAIYEPCEGDIWRDEAYCTNECESMAQQLIALISLPKSE